MESAVHDNGGVRPDLTEQILAISSDDWADPTDATARYWVVQAVRKITLLIGNIPVRFVAGAPFTEAGEATPETPGAIVVFTDDLLIRADIASAPGDTPGMRAAVAAIPRASMTTLEISPAPMNAPPTREWPRQSFLTAHYSGRDDPLTLPMIDTSSPAHRRELLDFLPSLVADLTRTHTP